MNNVQRAAGISGLPRDSALPDEFGSWISGQRWYGGKGRRPRLTRIGGWTIEPDESLRITTHFLLDNSGRTPTLYQVPISERTSALDSVQPIGTDGERFFYDAPHDPGFAPAMFEMIQQEIGFATDSETDSVSAARGHRQPGTARFEIAASAVLRGEQSNTSIICEVVDGPPVILKLFRALHHGDNPDVVLQSAIAAAGSSRVPTSIGFVSGEWQDSGEPDGIARGHLAFAQAFVVGAEDAWRIALTAAQAGQDFSERARELGSATAEVHATLATALPTRPATREDIDGIVAGMRARLDRALDEVPSLEETREVLETVFTEASRAPWPALQRIHGDYHLGQVLATPDGGWVLVDFEGEPLRSMTERSEPDVTVRDVAGMLRSFDYVAGSVEHDGEGESPRDWAVSAREAFIDGYSERSGSDIRAHLELLDAFEIDKALYEAVYEVRNRPDWVSIPVSAIRRLAFRHGGTGR